MGLSSLLVEIKPREDQKHSVEGTMDDLASTPLCRDQLQRCWVNLFSQHQTGSEAPTSLGSLNPTLLYMTPATNLSSCTVKGHNTQPELLISSYICDLSSQEGVMTR